MRTIEAKIFKISETGALLNTVVKGTTLAKRFPIVYLDKIFWNLLRPESQLYVKIKLNSVYARRV